ncbi:O-antigen ligase domain-containing protein [Dolichospermum sp. ST_con]|nr:O-antigen ligase domain-containing protein [Dolichospermum sp. ST_con]MDD1419070.1 O-antigen ligase domain-containing protein [Dolichospermum sp. ST_sed1]MDD1424261.1 O-antigen ligase domain-containing protein [Dolichospermum sp. ST_sed9]MDD1440539.1 O-antigen ligase domain-containing protein [Dolichospermum sp. ST_sed3]MDD1446095.1 O-antigen ligase domain-containing protein [Dolichospermum sp. ST_sed8]MDD1454713.1 O-antigen ligase domain-containing protein [Dolichospermum sp. ST_sed7]MDD1
MDFVNTLLDFLPTPLGLILIGTGLFMVIQANQKRPRLGWFMIAIFGFSASLNKFGNEFIKEPPALVFPLQQIREVGRPITIVLLLLLIIISLKTKNIWRQKIIPQPIFYLILVQSVIFCKILFYGNLGFAFLSAATFGGLVLVVILGPSRWLQNEENFQLGVWAIAMVGVIFGIANGYQALIDKYAITFVHGWFLGTTGNPHHAAILITATIPAFLFLFFHNEKHSWTKWIWVGFLALAIFGLLMTASRTGAIVAVVSVLIFFRHQGGKLLQIVLIFAVIAAFVLPSLSPTDIDTPGLLSATSSKWSNLDISTRDGVWSGYWRLFLKYPLFGAPFEGDRLRFGESSWLGVLGSMGLVGAIPMFMFGWTSLQMIFKLDHLSKIRPDYYLKCSVVMAGLLSLLVGGVSEAYLLGNLTFSLLAVFLYLVLGNYLIEFAQREYNYSISQYYHNYMLSSES